MFGIFWIALFVVLAVWGWSFLKKEKGLGFGNTGESALDILKQRYSKGEISKEEFNGKKAGLGLVTLLASEADTARRAQANLFTIAQKLKIIVENA